MPIFGVLGARLADIDVLFVSITVMLLCFIMGLQNATITKLSNSEIRTTHITVIVTDIGIELGKLMYLNSSHRVDQPKVVANRPRMVVLISLGVFFFADGVTGAFGFKHVGYVATVPLAIVLVTLAIVPTMDDLMAFLRKVWIK